MSDGIYGQSYLLEIHRSMPSADALGALIGTIETANVSIMSRYQKIGMYVQDMLEKFGYMHYSLEEMNECSNKVRPDTYAKFYFYSFIYMAKATLDTGAVILNEIFRLKFRGGQIDLIKNDFRNAITLLDVNLTKTLQEYDNDLHTIDKWRDATIHNKGVRIFRLGSASETSDYFIPKEPLSPAEMVTRSKDLGKDSIEARELCRGMLWSVQQIAEAILDSVVSRIGSVEILLS
jgi:hypothetical protein